MSGGPKALATHTGQHDDATMPDETAAAFGTPNAGDKFSGLPAHALLANGQQIVLAPARPQDAGVVRSFYDSLSDTATYYRFFGMRPALIEDELRHVVEQEVPRHVTLFAWLDTRLIGVAEFVSGADPEEAEVAIVVADDHHHEGVATLLLERLVMVARRCGILRFVARTLRGNEEMKLVLRTLGLSERIELSDGIMVFTLDLTSYEEMQRQAAVRLEQAMRAASELRSQPPPTDD